MNIDAFLFFISKPNYIYIYILSMNEYFKIIFLFDQFLLRYTAKEPSLLDKLSKTNTVRV